MTPPKHLVTIGLLGALAVALGALGAHFLKNKMAAGLITPDQLNGFDTGVKYHIYHVIAMLLVVLLNTSYSSKWFSRAYVLFLTGIVLFSGSLYVLCTRQLTGLEGLTVLGPVTPIGGLFFVAGWLCLVMPAFVKKS